MMRGTSKERCQGMKEEKRRRILFEGYARAHPGIQAAMQGGMDINAAVLFMKENCPPILEEIVERTNESLAAGHKMAHTHAGMYGETLSDDPMKLFR